MATNDARIVLRVGGRCFIMTQSPDPDLFEGDGYEVNVDRSGKKTKLMVSTSNGDDADVVGELTVEPPKTGTDRYIGQGVNNKALYPYRSYNETESARAQRFNYICNPKTVLGAALEARYLRDQADGRDVLDALPESEKCAAAWENYIDLAQRIEKSFFIVKNAKATPSEKQNAYRSINLLLGIPVEEMQRNPSVVENAINALNSPPPCDEVASKPPVAVEPPSAPTPVAVEKVPEKIPEKAPPAVDVYDRTTLTNLVMGFKRRQLGRRDEDSQREISYVRIASPAVSLDFNGQKTPWISVTIAPQKTRESLGNIVQDLTDSLAGRTDVTLVVITQNAMGPVQAEVSTAITTAAAGKISVAVVHQARPAYKAEDVMQPNKQEVLQGHITIAIVPRIQEATAVAITMKVLKYYGDYLMNRGFIYLDKVHGGDSW